MYAYSYTLDLVDFKDNAWNEPFYNINDEGNKIESVILLFEYND